MSRQQSLERIVIAAHTLTRMAAHASGNEAPAAQWRALAVLQRQGPLRVGALADAARTTQPGMTRLLGQLEEDGLVTRDRDDADSRVTLVAITAAGEDAIDRWRHQLGEVLLPLFDELGDEEWAALEHAADILTARTTTPMGAQR